MLVPDVSTLEAIEKRLADAGVPFDGSTDPNGLPTIATHDLDGIGVVVRVGEGA